jgi:excisionase family DNA binding protein
MTLISQEPEYFTVEELATKLNLARKTIKKWTIARRIPGQVKCGGRWRYRRTDIEKALLRGEFLAD